MSRLDRVFAELKSRGIDGYLVLNPVNIGYLSGFPSRDCYVFISEKMQALITDTRYTEQAEQVLANTVFKVIPWRTPYPPFEEVLVDLCVKAGVHKLGFESDRMPYGLYARCLQEATAKGGLELVSVGGFDHALKVSGSLVEDLRYVRDDEELARIQKACEISCQALEKTLKRFEHGMTTGAFARILAEEQKNLGADRRGGIAGWPLTGAISSVPHGSADDLPIEEGAFLLLDFGAAYMGYSCDMTRTFVVGKADARQKRIHELVVAAQKAALEKMVAGSEAWEPDTAARKVILDSEFQEFAFTYGVAHGVGLEVHETPFCFTGNSQKLAVGNTISVEPGIYIPGYGGFRLEDVIHITANGPVYLTHFPRELIEL
ncbi:MAG: Xaa-Pro peptidase family protein [Symbiobacteriaceae bacterium]|nr:Xaa-Pro peptidase family protein [Symbiobacteriaceae bacterium]